MKLPQKEHKYIEQATQLQTTRWWECEPLTAQRSVDCLHSLQHCFPAPSTWDCCWKDSHSGAFCLGYLSFSTNNTLLWKHRSGRKYAVYSNKNNFTILMESLNRVPLSCAATAHPTGTALEPCVCCSQQPEAVPLCMSTCASPTRHSHCSHQHNSLKLTPLSPQLSPEMD